MNELLKFITIAISELGPLIASNLRYSGFPVYPAYAQLKHKVH